MTEENFKKGIEELKNIRMTNAEKTHMLERVLSAPIESPYMKPSPFAGRRMPVFAFIYSQHTRVILTSCLILVLSIGGATYASGTSLPGDLLYPIKTRVVEPMLDIVNSAPEKKIVWEEQKVERRIVEAEMLAEKDKLDEEKLVALEQSIEKSSVTFAKAVNAVASSTATATSSAKEQAENRKQEFRKKINERKEIFEQEEENQKVEKEQKEVKEIKVNSKTEKIKRLKNTAIKSVDNEDKFGDGKDEKSNNWFRD